MGVEFDQKSRKSGHKKNRRFVKIWVTFLSFLSENCPIGIYRTTAPTKSTVLGPGPPPWENVKIYRFLWFFWYFGAFNIAGYSVSKIGIYALPPLKSEIYGTFNNSRPNLSTHHDSLYVGYCFPLLVFWSSTGHWLFWPIRVFLSVVGFSFDLVGFCYHASKSDSRKTQTKAPQTRDFTGAGNSSLPNFFPIPLFYRDSIYQAKT
jgi:hypothetical protein